jgi:hypothetical protein
MRTRIQACSTHGIQTPYVIIDQLFWYTHRRREATKRMTVMESGHSALLGKPAITLIASIRKLARMSAQVSGQSALVGPTTTPIASIRTFVRMSAHVSGHIARNTHRIHTEVRPNECASVWSECSCGQTYDHTHRMHTLYPC